MSEIPFKLSKSCRATVLFVQANNFWGKDHIKETSPQPAAAPAFPVCNYSRHRTGLRTVAATAE